MKFTPSQFVLDLNHSVILLAKVALCCNPATYARYLDDWELGILRMTYAHLSSSISTLLECSGCVWPMNWEMQRRKLVNITYNQIYITGTTKICRSLDFPVVHFAINK